MNCEHKYDKFAGRYSYNCASADHSSKTLNVIDYCPKTEKEIIELVERKEYDELYMSYIPMINKLVNKTFFKNMSKNSNSFAAIELIRMTQKDDLVYGVAYESIIEAVGKYDKSLGSFTNILYTILKGNFNFALYVPKFTNMIYTESYCRENNDGEVAFQLENIQEENPVDVTVSCDFDVLEKAINQLDDCEKFVICGLYGYGDKFGGSTLKYKELAEAIGRTNPGSVANIENIAMAKLRQYLQVETINND